MELFSQMDTSKIIKIILFFGDSRDKQFFRKVFGLLRETTAVLPVSRLRGLKRGMPPEESSRSNTPN